MQGLLGTSMDDPRTMAVLQGVMGLLGARGGVQGVAQGLLGYQGAMQQAKQQAAVEQMRQMQLAQHAMQLEQARKAAAQQELDRKGLMAMNTPISGIEANRASGLTGPTPQAAAAIGQFPKLDPRVMLSQGMSPEAVQTAVSLSQIGVKQPIKLGAGEAVFDPSGKMLFGNPKEDATDPFIRMLKQSGIDPASPQGQAIIQAKIRKDTTHAPATSVSVNTEKPLLNTLATGLGKQLDDGLSGARAANTAITNAQTLRKAAESGNLIAGPTASIRIPLLQVGQMLGIGGKDDAERLANTRQAVQTMAQAELDAAQQMKGQGQITEAERDIIRRAAAGDINSFTAPEISQLSQAIEKTARAKIASHRRSVGALQNIKGAESLIPFYQVDEPAPYAAPNSGGGWSIRPIGGN